MIQKLLLLLFIMSIIFLLGSFVSAQGLYYAIEITSDQETISIRDVQVLFSQEPLENVVNDHYFKTYALGIYDGENQRKDTIDFGFVNLAVSDVLEGEELVSGERIRLNNVSFIVYAPYHDDGQEIIMYDEEGQRIAYKGVSELSRVTREESDETKKEENAQKEKRTSLKDEIGSSAFMYGFIFVLLSLILYMFLRKTLSKK